MEIEQDINHILEVLSSQSPKVALRTIKRLEDRLYKLREDILIREASKPKVDHQKVIYDWLKDKLPGKAEYLRIFQTNVREGEAGESEYIYTVIDPATYRPPTEHAIGRVIVTSGGAISSDIEALQQKLREVRQVTEEHLTWINSKENFPGFFYHAFVVEVLLPEDRIKDMLRKALTTNIAECVYKGRIQWELFNKFLPANWPNLTRFDFKSSAQEHLCNLEIKDDFENSAWWWKAHVIDGITDPTKWLIEQRDSGVSPKEIGILISGLNEQVNPSARGEKIIETCRKKLSNRDMLRERIRNIYGEEN